MVVLTERQRAKSESPSRADELRQPSSQVQTQTVIVSKPVETNLFFFFYRQLKLLKHHVSYPWIRILSFPWIRNMEEVTRKESAIWRSVTFVPVTLFHLFLLSYVMFDTLLGMFCYTHGQMRKCGVHTESKSNVDSSRVGINHRETQ